MSAINPASFVTPPTAGLSSNPLGYGQEGQPDRRHHENRAYGGARDGTDAGRDAIANQMGLLRNAYADPYQAFGQGARQPDPGVGALGSGLQSQADPFAPYSPGYGSLESGYADYGNSGGGSAQRVHPTSGDWASRFQGLSLGS